MTNPQATPGFSPLDRAWAARLAGDPVSALRLACSILAGSPGDVGAAALACRILIDTNRAVVAGETAARLVPAYIARGDLAGACYAVRLATEAGDYAPDGLATIAAAYGKGSARLGDASAKPPPLPGEVDIAPHFAERTGSELVAAAEQVLKHAADQLPTTPGEGPLPRLPLFSELAPPILKRFMGALAPHELPAGHTVAKEGDAGDEAFILVRGLLNVVRTRDQAVLAALGPGAIFGEMALVSAAPRTASVVAVEPSLVLSIARADLERLSAKEPAIGRELGAFCHRRMVSNLVQHSPILSALAPDARQALMARFTPRAFSAGDRLVEAGKQGQGLALIASGGVEVRGADSEGDTVVLAQLGPGQVVGEISLVLRRPATADVVAVHPTVALTLTEDAFQGAIRDSAELLRELYELALHREQETRSAVAQQALDVSDVTLF